MQTLTIDRLYPNHAPAYVANGVVGLRVPQVSITGGRCTLSGFTTISDSAGVETWEHPPYPLAVHITVNGQSILRDPSRVRFVNQSYNLATAELTTELQADIDGLSFAIQTLTFCSQSHPTLVLQRTTVTPTAQCSLSLQGGTDESTFPGTVTERHDGIFRGRRIVDRAIECRSRSGRSRCGIAFVAHSDASKPIDALPHHRYELTQISSVVSHAFHPQPMLHAARLCSTAWTRGFDWLREQHRACWHQLWSRRVVIDCDDRRVQPAIDACYFYVQTSFHRSSPAPSGLLGLSMWPNYHYFNGHQFWDIDTFCVPLLTMINPPAAEQQVRLRFNALPAARQNAAAQGYGGAQYPWEAGSDGFEATPVDYAHLLREQHVSADVAIAAARYARSRGLSSDALQLAWPIVRDVANWIVSRVRADSAGDFHIDHCCGIDEGRHDVNDNIWTNASCKIALQEAIAIAGVQGAAVLPEWGEIARRLVIPTCPRRGILINHAACELDQAICPESLATIWPLEYPHDAEVARRTIRYVLDRRAGYAGFPMLSTPMFVWAAILGDRALSARLFEEGVLGFINEPFMQIDEFSQAMTQSKPQVGPYLAHCASAVAGVLMGLTGKSAWRKPFQSPCLPDGWSRISSADIAASPAVVSSVHQETIEETPRSIT